MKVGLDYEATFSENDPTSAVAWEKRTASIPPVFEQPDVEVPVAWSQLATNIVASKYFYGQQGTPERETSIAQLIERVAGTIADWGVDDGYFTLDDAVDFYHDLAYLCLHQYASFNSPVWFNVGLFQRYGVTGAACTWRYDLEAGKVYQPENSYEFPQASACFIQGVRDNMEDIMELAKSEAMLFKFGSGTGSNMSSLRATCERLSGGGKPSGPLSFMRVYDSVAGVVKSGGKCLAGNQRVYTANGPVPVEQLDCQQFVVLSYDPPTGRFKAKRAEAWMSGRKPVIRIVTDKGNYDVSSDHPMRTSDNRVVKAADLKPGMSLFQCSVDGISWRPDHPGHSVQSIEELGVMPVYSVEVDCPTPDDKSPESGHNYVIWPNDSSTGSGVVVLNTRRAAVLRCLDVDHPDIIDFVKIKQLEEEKARALKAAGYTDEEATSTVSMQNANLSVRLSDDFMRAVEADAEWPTRWVTDPEVKGPTYKARTLLRAIAEAAWACGDPGVQYDTTINDWHTCPQSGPIRSSNPCCFTGDTEILTHRGRRTIEELMRLDVPPRAFSWDERRWMPVQRQIKRVWQSGLATKLVEVETDRCFKGRSTPEHRYLLHNGEYRPAGELQVGDKLRGVDLTSCGCHYVVKVTHLDVEPTPVYDLEIEGTHNFVVCSGHPDGPVVHNSEYMFIDDSACNLASINLMKFRREDGSFDTNRFKAACRTIFIAQEIIVGRASYPTPKIAEHSAKFRPIGLGYTNLGSLLMANGLAYDSDEARRLAAGITSIMSATAYRTSAELARVKGPFAGYEANRESMLRVLAKHQAAAEFTGTDRDWTAAIEDCRRYGVRNAQVTVLAPTGTISFMMDCDTTGIEPEVALVKTKHLAGGGTLRIVNQTVRLALQTLGYRDQEIDKIVVAIEKSGTVKGSGVKPEHYPVFATAYGDDPIHYSAHLDMMAAVQPFISGAISKTVALPNSATVEDIERVYIDGWKHGLKAVAIYRDGSKGYQPLEVGTPQASASVRHCEREPLPDTRDSVTHKFSISGNEGYFTVGLYPDGRPGELFVTMAKEGSTLAGLMDAFGLSVSLALQYGVPLSQYVEKFVHTRFEPMGFTKNPDIRIAKSIIDYIFRWLELRFLRPAGEPTAEPVNGDAPACGACGSMTVRSGSCYLCPTCGTSLGCS